MMQLITSDRYGAFADDLAEMYRLRYRVFKQRLDWDVEVSGDMEIDTFDAPCGWWYTQSFTEIVKAAP